MRRSNFVIKLVSLVLFVAIACYIGLYIYNMAANPFQTTLAASITVEESSRVTGYVVREETVLSGGGDAVSITAQEGAKVSVGEEIAIAYASEAALQRASEIYSLEIQIDQLQSFGSGQHSFRLFQCVKRRFGAGPGHTAQRFFRPGQAPAEHQDGCFLRFRSAYCGGS